MDVLVVGGHGKIALRLLQLLAQRGHTARGLIRKPEQAPDLESRGAIPVLGDLENDESLVEYVRGADAVVFAAGAGPGSSTQRKWSVDYGGAVKLIESAKAAGVSRYVIISSVGAHAPEQYSGTFQIYLEAKAKADEELIKSGLDWTIVRPGSLTDDPGTGLVRVSTEPGGKGSVPRDDVAAVLADVIEAPNTIHVLFELFSGDTPVPEAIRALR
jgi:uncharacterized protein YbjT (DUF2867 family)